MIFWLPNLDFSRKKTWKYEKRDPALIRKFFFYYQINRLGKLSYHQFFGTYISDRWCHITLFLEFLRIFSKYFSTTGKKKFAEKIFADVSDNLKKMKKKFRKKNFSKKFENFSKIFFQFFKSSKTSAKFFSANFFSSHRKILNKNSQKSLISKSYVIQGGYIAGSISMIQTYAILWFLA